jgi:hypothetical protein
MALSLLPRDVVIKMMIILDVKNMKQLGLCSYQLFGCFLDENLWAIKLEMEFRLVKYKTINSIESYKWCARVDSISETKWRPDFSYHRHPVTGRYVKRLRTQHEKNEKSLNEFFRTLLIKEGPNVLTNQETMLVSIKKFRDCPNDKKLLLKDFCQKYFTSFTAFTVPK